MFLLALHVQARRSRADDAKASAKEAENVIGLVPGYHYIVQEDGKDWRSIFLSVAVSF